MSDLFSLVAYDRELVRRHGLLAFGVLAWPILWPGQLYVHNWHIAQICKHVEACYFGELPELLINVPPGTGKSVWCSVMADAWALAVRPDYCMLNWAFDDSLCDRDAGRVLRIMQSRWYQERWPATRLTKVNPPLGEFYTTSGGLRYSSSVHGRGTGRHGHVRKFDDPIKPSDTMGSALTTRVEIDYVNHTFWDGTVSTRTIPGQTPRYLGIMQRLHEDDLVGHLQRTAQPTTLRLPMRYDASKPCVTRVGGDPRTVDGELLFPELYPESRVVTLERSLGTFASAQLQQTPTNPEGEVFKAKDIRRWAELPTKWDTLLLSGDMSFKKTAGCDRCSLQVWGKVGARLLLVDQIVGLMGFADAVRHCRLLIARHSEIGPILIEDTANGPAVIEELREQLPGVISIKPEGGKLSRANAVVYLFESESVELPPEDWAPWVIGYTTELLGFPKASHDDQVDATTQALGWLVRHSSNLWAWLEQTEQCAVQEVPEVQVDMWGEIVVG